METVLQINALFKNYGMVRAVDNLTLTIHSGNVYGILGPNGSGKTTTLGIILGTVLADSGTFAWFNNTENTLANNKIGALLEMPNFYPYLSLTENLKIACSIKNITQNIAEEIDRVLRITNLYERRFSAFSSMSFGMRQRLAISSMLLGDPQVLVFDEPTNGLDPQGIAEIREIILNEAKKGKTIIMASHILDEVEKVCSHVAILQKGKLLANGPVTELLRGDDIIIITAEQPDALYDCILQSGMCKEIARSNNDILITLATNYQPKDINEFAFKNGFVLSKFEIRKKTLEQQFLELVK